MAFSSQMHHEIGLEPVERCSDARQVADVAPDEPIARILCDRGERCQITGVGKAIENEHLMTGPFEDGANERGPDETGPSGDQDSFQGFTHSRLSFKSAQLGERI
jgi:hypothetical protein